MTLRGASIPFHYPPQDNYGTPLMLSGLAHINSVAEC
jgi:hypothetical protein